MKVTVAQHPLVLMKLLNVNLNLKPVLKVKNGPDLKKPKMMAVVLNGFKLTVVVNMMVNTMLLVLPLIMLLILADNVLVLNPVSITVQENHAIQLKNQHVLMVKSQDWYPLVMSDLNVVIVGSVTVSVQVQLKKH